MTGNHEAAPGMANENTDAFQMEVQRFVTETSYQEPQGAHGSTSYVDIRGTADQESSSYIDTLTASTYSHLQNLFLLGDINDYQFAREKLDGLVSRLESFCAIVDADRLSSAPNSRFAFAIHRRSTASEITIERLHVLPDSEPKGLESNHSDDRPPGNGDRAIFAKHFASALDKIESSIHGVDSELVEVSNRCTELNGTELSGKVLVVCNAYPSDSQIYRNGFIHSRVEKYREAGVNVEVFYLHPPASESTEYEYKGIHVALGNRGHFEEYLSRHEHEIYLVHFATADMIQPIRQAFPKKNLIVWIHGFEAESWHRRWFNFLDSPESIRKILEMKNDYYEKQQRFNKELYRNETGTAHFVNVSQWFKEHVVEPDAGVAFREQDSSIIPNFIDESFFHYVPKSSEMRKHILSIRPYASHKYANDLTVDAILELSSRPWFTDLKFTIIGDGLHFESTTAPLKHFPNVKVLRRFLGRELIRREHRRNGVFLAPTRFDSQGVSTNEAMSSGLVPISTNISAIPEFITHFKSGLLAEPEKSSDLARLVELIYFDPSFYHELSNGAACAVRQKAGFDSTVGKEISLIHSKLKVK